MVIFFISFSASMGQFETGNPPSKFASVLSAVTTILHFPLVTLMVPIFPKWAIGPLEYLPFMLNSLLWGAALSCLITFIQQRRQNR